MHELCQEVPAARRVQVALRLQQARSERASGRLADERHNPVTAMLIITEVAVNSHAVSSEHAADAETDPPTIGHREHERHGASRRQDQERFCSRCTWPPFRMRRTDCLWMLRRCTVYLVQ